MTDTSQHTAYVNSDIRLFQQKKCYFASEMSVIYDDDKLTDDVNERRMVA